MLFRSMFQNTEKTQIVTTRLRLEDSILPAAQSDRHFHGELGFVALKAASALSLRQPIAMPQIPPKPTVPKMNANTKANPASFQLPSLTRCAHMTPMTTPVAAKGRRKSTTQPG